MRPAVQTCESKKGAIRADKVAADLASPETTQRHAVQEIVENAEYRDALGRVMKVISIEDETVYYGIRGQCLFRPLKATLLQFRSLAGLKTESSHLRLVVNAV